MIAERGTVVTFTSGPLGLVTDVRDSRFRDEVVQAGEIGVYVGSHPVLGAGWHVVRVGELVCPCHSSQFTIGGPS